MTTTSTLNDIYRRLGIQHVSRPNRIRARRKKRLMNSWVWDSTEVSKKFMEQSKDIFIGATDIGDYITNDILMERNARCISTFHEEVTVLASLGEWLTFALSTGLRVVQFREGEGICVVDEDLSYFKYEINSSSTIVKLYGDVAFVDTWTTAITDKFEPVKNVIEWIYNSDGQSIEVPLRGDRIPVEEMYPWLDGENLPDYYDRFMESDASILLLIGPPGTGKTTFIRGLLQHTEQSAIVTYDANILSKDYLFAQFIEGDRGILVIEDADNFLGARSDGNDMMHKFLNVGDGLVTTKNKKMIFSTNLPSIRDIDPALIRPGRCFDIVNFSPLSEEQAQALAKRINVKYDSKTEGQYSIADIFHKQVQAPKSQKRKVGFV
jgi:hypothetical protein